MDTKPLQERISGTVVQRGDEHYERVRQDMVWNALKPKRYPDLIVEVASENDVIEAVKFARQQNMKVAVRGGGHSWIATSLREGGVLLDLSRLSNVSIDPNTRVATIQPHVINRDLARRLAEYDLAFPVGHCSDISASGFILSGGLGWNGGSWGIACFSLLSMDVVTAEGKLVTASETENANLFWAARGAGSGFFGVATKYRLKVYPLPKTITTSILMYPLENLPEVVEWAAETVITLPRNVEFSLVLASAPPSIDESCDKVCILSATVFADSEEEAIEALLPFAMCSLNGCVVKELNIDTPFEALFDTMDNFYPPGKRYAVDTMWSNAQPIEVLTRVQEHFANVPSKRSIVLASIVPPPSADALSLPSAAFSILASVFVACYSIWDDPEQDEADIGWLRTTMSALEPLAVGHYIGESDLVANPSRSMNSFAKPNWERLQALREEYDPDGVFHSYIGLN